MQTSRSQSNSSAENVSTVNYENIISALQDELNHRIDEFENKINKRIKEAAADAGAQEIFTGLTKEIKEKKRIVDALPGSLLYNKIVGRMERGFTLLVQDQTVHSSNKYPLFSVKFKNAKPDIEQYLICIGGLQRTRNILSSPQIPDHRTVAQIQVETFKAAFEETFKNLPDLIKAVNKILHPESSILARLHERLSFSSANSSPALTEVKEPAPTIKSAPSSHAQVSSLALDSRPLLPPCESKIKLMCMRKVILSKTKWISTKNDKEIFDRTGRVINKVPLQLAETLYTIDKAFRDEKTNPNKINWDKIHDEAQRKNNSLETKNKERFSKAYIFELNRCSPRLRKMDKYKERLMCMRELILTTQWNSSKKDEDVKAHQFTGYLFLRQGKVLNVVPHEMKLILDKIDGTLYKEDLKELHPSKLPRANTEKLTILSKDEESFFTTLDKYLNKNIENSHSVQPKTGKSADPVQIDNDWIKINEEVDALLTKSSVPDLALLSSLTKDYVAQLNLQLSESSKQSKKIAMGMREEIRTGKWDTKWGGSSEVAKVLILPNGMNVIWKDVDAALLAESKGNDIWQQTATNIQSSIAASLKPKSDPSCFTKIFNFFGGRAEKTQTFYEKYNQQLASHNADPSVTNKPGL